jgi:hypothetical protein
MKRNSRTDIESVRLFARFQPIRLSVQIAEEVEDEDDRQGNPNQPKDEATAHVKLPELLCSSSRRT